MKIRILFLSACASMLSWAGAMGQTTHVIERQNDTIKISVQSSSGTSTQVIVREKDGKKPVIVNKKTTRVIPPIYPEGTDTVRLKNKTLIITKDRDGDPLVKLRTRTAKNREYESEILSRRIVDGDKEIEQNYRNTWMQRAWKKYKRRDNDHILLSIYALNPYTWSQDAVRPLSFGWSIDFLAGSHYLSKNLYITGGIGFGTETIAMEPNYGFYDHNGVAEVKQNETSNVYRSRLHFAYFRFPLLLVAHAGKSHLSGFVGVTPKWMLDSSHGIWSHYPQTCVETMDGSNMMPIVVDLTAGIRYRSVLLSASMNPYSLVRPQRGENLQVFRAGLSVAF